MIGVSLLLWFSQVSTRSQFAVICIRVVVVVVQQVGEEGKEACASTSEDLSAACPRQTKTCPRQTAADKTPENPQKPSLALCYLSISLPITCIYSLLCSLCLLCSYYLYLLSHSPQLSRPQSLSRGPSQSRSASAAPESSFLDCHVHSSSWYPFQRTRNCMLRPEYRCAMIASTSHC